MIFLTITCKKDEKKDIVQLNTEYRFRVVRISLEEIVSYKFRVQIVSSEIGEWTESIMSSRKKFKLSHFDNGNCFANVCKWNDIMDELSDFIIGLNPFHFQPKIRFYFVALNGTFWRVACQVIASLKIFNYDFHVTGDLLVWDLNDEGTNGEAGALW